jgi:hypothetical protein
MSDVRCDSICADGMRCDLTSGHDGMHHAERDLPPDVARLVEASMTEMDRWARRSRIATRWYYAGVAVFWGYTLVSVLLTYAYGPNADLLTAFAAGVASAGILAILLLWSRTRPPKRRATYVEPTDLPPTS